MRHDKDCPQYEPIHIHCPDLCTRHEPDSEELVIAHRHIEGEHEMDNPQCWCQPFFYTVAELRGRSPEEIYAEVEERGKIEERGN